MNKQTIAVLGLGLFGVAVARTLAQKGVEVIALDSNMDHVNEVSDVVELAMQVDFTKIDQLRAAGVENCDTAIIATGERLEVTILGIMNLKKLGIKNVIVKTKNLTYREVLLKVGADRVILPEVEMGTRLAHDVSSTDVLDVIRLDDKYNVAEIHALPQWCGHEIQSLDIREKYGINIIALKAVGKNDFSISVEPQHIIKQNDILVLLYENTPEAQKLIKSYQID